MLRHGRRDPVPLVEVDPGERAPILRQFLAAAPGAWPHLPVDRQAARNRLVELSAYPLSDR